MLLNHIVNSTLRVYHSTFISVCNAVTSENSVYSFCNPDNYGELGRIRDTFSA